MRDVFVVGVGMTRFSRSGGRSVRSLTTEAVAQAYADTGLATGATEIIFFGNAAAGVLTGQEMMRGQAALQDTGLSGLPVTNVENACASGSTAFNGAWRAVASGEFDIALAVGAEKLTHEDKSRSFAALETAVDQEALPQIRQQLYGTDQVPEGRSMFMDVYATLATAYMDKSGASAHDFAVIAAKNHDHGALNPDAQYRDRVTVDEVLASRHISGPLTLLMCSPIGDGAAALLLASEEVRDRLGAPPVRVAASVLASGNPADEDSPVHRAAQRAYDVAHIAPEDVDVVELHDAAAPAELIAYEELGLCVEGEGPKLLATGATALGGRLPVNPSGGLLSRGHPVGATGCAQLVELTRQLRQQCGPRQVPGARVALAENAGGLLGLQPAAACITILHR